MKGLFFILLLFCCREINSQTRITDQLSFQMQLTFQIGQPVNQVGFRYHLNYAYRMLEVGAGVQSKIFFSGLGPRGVWFENRAELIAKLVWGDTLYRNPQFLNPLFNASNRSKSIAYAYYWYVDTRQTSQRSGAWGLQVDRVFASFENDIFGGQGRDRFRTGTFHLMYFDSLNLLSLNALIWTGETDQAITHGEQSIYSPRGYKDLSGNLYGRYSHGILSVSYFRATDFQPVGIELGIDHEQIRHNFQNRLVHNFPYFFMEKPIRTRMLPMLDENGMPYLDPQTQKLAKPKLVYQAQYGFTLN